MKNKYKGYAYDLVNQCNEIGIQAYIYHVAMTGSVYIRFKDRLLGSIRIGDHTGKEKYRYKFNIRDDMKKFSVKNDRGVRRFYFPMTDYGRNTFIKILKKSVTARNYTQEQSEKLREFDARCQINKKENVWT